MGLEKFFGGGKSIERASTGAEKSKSPSGTSVGEKTFNDAKAAGAKSSTSSKSVTSGSSGTLGSERSSGGGGSFLGSLFGK